jgi:peptide/nickel transport system substrate-binding protein
MADDATEFYQPMAARAGNPADRDQMRNAMRFLLNGLIASLLAVLLAAGFGGTALASEGQIVVAQSSDILTLDPSASTDPISLNVFKNIYDQLTDIAADGSVAPLLAKSWTSADGLKEWTFTLAKGVTFHDGSPLTAQDVVWTYQKIMDDPKSPVRAYLTTVKKVEAVGDDAVRFTLSVPFAPFPRQVSLVSILPEKAYKERSADFARHPVGSGPYKVVEWQKDDRLVLEAFPGYFGGAPKIARVIFRPVPAEATRASGLLSGDLDIVPILPPSLIEPLARAKDIHVEKVKSNRVLYLGFDVNNPALKSVQLRQAIDYAINREAICRDLLRGLGTPEGQVVAPVTFGYDKDITATAFDPARARELVAQSGYAGESILFQYPINRYAFGQEVAQAVAGYLKAVGVNVQMQGMEYSAFFPLWLNKKLSGINLFAYGPSIMDSDLPIGSLYESGSSRGSWTSPEVDELVKQQRAESDPVKRAALIGKIWKISKENVPYVILYDEIQAYGIRNGVNWTPRPDERLIFNTATLAK